MVDWHTGNRPWLRQPQIDSDPAFALGRDLPTAPECHAAAGRAKMELHAVTPDVGGGRPVDRDAFAFKVVDPQHAITPAHRAIAGGGSFRKAVVRPVPGDCSAVA